VQSVFFKAIVSLYTVIYVKATAISSFILFIVFCCGIFCMGFKSLYYYFGIII
jgi:hypothetical protein